MAVKEREKVDFRSDRMPSPDGQGIARRAWEAYASTVRKVATPAVEPVARYLAGRITSELAGFWLIWHLEGGFEGMQRLGMSRASIYRRVSAFRKAFGQHPDAYTWPGVTIDVAAYQEGIRKAKLPPL